MAFSSTTRRESAFSQCDRFRQRSLMNELREAEGAVLRKFLHKSHTDEPFSAGCRGSRQFLTRSKECSAYLNSADFRSPYMSGLWYDLSPAEQCPRLDGSYRLIRQLDGPGSLRWLNVGPRSSAEVRAGCHNLMRSSTLEVRRWPAPSNPHGRSPSQSEDFRETADSTQSGALSRALWNCNHCSVLQILLMTLTAEAGEALVGREEVS